MCGHGEQGAESGSRSDKKMKTHHMALKVYDLKRCGDFYATVLGLPLIKHQLDGNEEIRSVWFDLEGVILMLERCEDSAERQVAGHEGPHADGREEKGRHLLALSIPASSRSFWKEKLHREGVTILRESPYSIYFRDPENNNLALSHYPEPVAP